MYQDNNPLLPFSSAHHHYYILMPIWYLQIHWRDTNFWEEKVLQIRNRLFLHTNVPEALRIRTSKKRRVVVESVYRKVQYFIYKRFLLQLLFVHNAARLLAIHQKKGRKSIKMIFLLSHKYLFFLIHICKQAIVMTSFVQCFMVQFFVHLLFTWKPTAVFSLESL